MNPRNSLRLTAWLSLVAAFMLAFAPGVSRLLAAEGHQQVAWLCTSGGFVKVSLATGEPVAPDSEKSGHESALEHCKYCGLAALPLPSCVPGVVVAGLVTVRDVPAPPEPDPPAPPVWENARSRAPPSLA